MTTQKTVLYGEATLQPTMGKRDASTENPSTLGESGMVNQLIEDNRFTQLEDEIRELYLEISLLVAKNGNLQAENDRLMQQLASSSTGGH